MNTRQWYCKHLDIAYDADSPDEELVEKIRQALQAKKDLRLMDEAILSLPADQPTNRVIIDWLTVDRPTLFSEIDKPGMQRYYLGSHEPTRHLKSVIMTSTKLTELLTNGQTVPQAVQVLLWDGYVLEEVVAALNQRGIKAHKEPDVFKVKSIYLPDENIIVPWTLTLARMIELEIDFVAAYYPKTTLQ
jgi:hypothetical protein